MPNRKPSRAADKLRPIVGTKPAECEVCGSDDARQTTECPRCGKMRCEHCDAGIGTVCSACECGHE